MEEKLQHLHHNRHGNGGLGLAPRAVQHVPLYPSRHYTRSSSVARSRHREQHVSYCDLLGRMPELLSLLPQVNSLRLRNLGAHFDGHHWVSPATRPLPSMAEICQLFCRYGMECMHLKKSHFSAIELRMLLSALNPKRLFIDGCVMFTAFPVPGDPFKVTVASPPTRRDVGHSYLGQWPMRGRFTGEMHVHSSSESQTYTVYSTSRSTLSSDCTTKDFAIKGTWIIRSGEEPSCACVHRLD